VVKPTHIGFRKLRVAPMSGAKAMVVRIVAAGPRLSSLAGLFFRPIIMAAPEILTASL
jgi:hypothetical protein